MGEIRTAGVIGAGTMGNGIAHVFARSGYSVRLCEVEQRFLDRGRDTIRKNLAREVAKAKLTQEEMDAALGRIKGTLKRSDLIDCDFVVEAATERFDIKKEIFAELHSFMPAEVILASNTSSISITKLAAQTGRPDRVIGMHFFNPVPVMKLVEVVASPEAVDEVFKLGMAHPMGPLTLADFIGLDVCLDIMRVLQDGLGDPKYRPCPLLIRMVDAGWLGRKSGRGFYTY
jgi:3-hydroxybutyryl-CoA dehydrogenase